MIRIILLFSLTVLVFSLPACTGSDNIQPVAVATGTWTDAKVLIANAANPLIGADGNGNMIAVWEQRDGIHSACYNSYSGWGVPQMIMERAQQYSFFNYIRLAVNSKGDAVVAWVHEGTYPDYFIETVKYTAGSGWSEPQRLTPPNTVFSLDVALDADSNALIVWEGWDFPVVQRDIFASSSSGVSEWDAPQRISTNLWNAQNPRIAVDKKGNAIVLWVEGVYPNNIFANHYSANSGWSSPQQLATNTNGGAWPNIVFDNAGNAMAVWAQGDAANRWHIYSCRYVAGIGWNSSVVVDNNTFNSVAPALTVDRNGSFQVAWVQFTGISGDIFSSRSIASSGWEVPQLVGTGGYAYPPRVAADGLGNVFAVWYQENPNDLYPGDAKVYANRYSAESGWGTQIKLMNALGSADATELAVDPLGNAVVIWSQSVAAHPGSPDIFTSKFNNRSW